MSKPLPKSVPRRDKYFLRDLHQEIDFYDRKLAYLEKYMEFASAEERKQAEGGLLAKRAPLEKKALELAASGVEFDETDLPRSFRTMDREPGDASQKLILVKR